MNLTAKQILGNVLFLAVLLLILGRFLTIVAGTTFPLSVVASHSMEPALFKGDALPWIPCSIDAVEEGDVVVYASAQSWGKEKLVVHRVAAVRDTGGERTLITQGDANNFTDQAGPHVPEPPITGGMLKGKALQVADHPLKLPFAGYPWLLLHSGVDALTRSISWGQPQPRHHYGIFAPAAVALSFVVAGAVLWAPGKGRSTRERLHDRILGPERLSGKRVFFYVLLFYVVFLMIAVPFSYDQLSASVGVDESSPKSNIEFGTLHANTSSFPQSVSVVNPSLLPVHGFVFASGSIARFLDSRDITPFSLDSHERFAGNVTAYVPAGTTPGVYTGTLYIYSSPYWSLVPTSVIHSLHQWHPQGAVVVLTLLAAVSLAWATFLLLAAFSFLVERWQLARGYLAWRLLPVEARIPSAWHMLHRGAQSVKKLRHGIQGAFSWMRTRPHVMAGDMRKPFAVSLACVLVAAPLLYGPYDILSAMLAASMAGGILAYAMGCRWRSQFFHAALLTTGWCACLCMATSLVYVFQSNHSLFAPLASTVTVAGLVLLVFAVLAVPVGLLFWLPGHLIHSIREKWNPVVLLRGCDL